MTNESQSTDGVADDQALPAGAEAPLGPSDELAGELPLPLESASLDLPSDPEGPDFSAALQGLRPLYENRTSFNFMVCDQLAMRGVPPNGRNVQIASRWGNPAAIGADVKAWYAGLSTRLSSEHAKIPEAVKRGANGLLEQMWSLVLKAVQEPAQERINELHAELQGSIVELANAKERNEALATLAEETRLEGIKVADELKDKLSSAAVRVEVLDAQVRSLNDSISQAAVEHQRELRVVSAKYEEQMLGERRSHQDDLRRAAEDLAQANGLINKERDRLDAAAREHALAVDRFRQDVKEANQRADAAVLATAQAKGQVETLKDQVSAAEIRVARIEQEHAAERANLTTHIAGLDRDLMVSQAEKQSLASKVADLEEVIIANRATEAALRQQIDAKGKQ